MGRADSAARVDRTQLPPMTCPVCGGMLTPVPKYFFAYCNFCWHRGEWFEHHQLEEAKRGLVGK